MPYKLCKKMITNGNYTKDDMLNKLYVFFTTNRLTEEQYRELVALMDSKIN